MGYHAINVVGSPNCLGTAGECSSDKRFDNDDSTIPVKDLVKVNRNFGNGADLVVMVNAMVIGRDGVGADAMYTIEVLLLVSPFSIISDFLVISDYLHLCHRPLSLSLSQVLEMQKLVTTTTMHVNSYAFGATCDTMDGAACNYVGCTTMGVDCIYKPCIMEGGEFPIISTISSN